MVSIEEILKNANFAVFDEGLISIYNENMLCRFRAHKVPKLMDFGIY